MKVVSEPGRPHPCCVPSKTRAVLLDASRQMAAERVKANTGSTEGMVKLDGGLFWMGTDSAEGSQPMAKDPSAMSRWILLHGFLSGDQRRLS
jgi:hypothetical protein